MDAEVGLHRIEGSDEVSHDDALGLELRFRRNADADADAWSRTLDRIAGWNAALRPLNAVRLDDPEQRYLPWTRAMADAIAQACEAGNIAGWMLTGPGDGPGAITLQIGGDQLRLSLALPRPACSLPNALRELLDALNPQQSPALAMAFDLFDQTDAEVVCQGLHGIDRITPLVYLDIAAIHRAGGRQYVLAAPCAVTPAQGGLLLEVESDPWRTPREQRLQRASAVARHFGIRPGHPLILWD